MATVTRHSATCKIKMTRSEQLTEAVVDKFREHEHLTVIVNKLVKISMRWNGKVYEGRSAGMDFVSDGPTVTHTQTGSRG
jgi:hypothetical protein